MYRFSTKIIEYTKKWVVAQTRPTFCLSGTGGNLSLCSIILVLGIIGFLSPFVASAAATSPLSVSVQGQVLEQITYIQNGDKIEVSTNAYSGAIALSNNNTIAHFGNTNIQSFKANNNFILSANL